MPKYLVAVSIGAFTNQLNAQADHYQTVIGSGKLVVLVRACRHRCKGTTPWKCSNSHTVSWWLDTVHDYWTTTAGLITSPLTEAGVRQPLPSRSRHRRRSQQTVLGRRRRKAGRDKRVWDPLTALLVQNRQQAACFSVYLCPNCWPTAWAPTCEAQLQPESSDPGLSATSVLCTTSVLAHPVLFNHLHMSMSEFNLKDYLTSFLNFDSCETRYPTRKISGRVGEVCFLNWRQGLGI